MSFNLEIEKSGHYLFVTAYGDRTRENLISIASEVVDECAKQAVDEALVDISNLKGRISISDSYSIASKEIPKLHKLGILKKVVLVDAERRGERIQFFGRIARSLGINIQVFMDIDEAKKSMDSKEICKPQ